MRLGYKRNCFESTNSKPTSVGEKTPTIKSTAQTSMRSHCILDFGTLLENPDLKFENLSRNDRGTDRRAAENR